MPDRTIRLRRILAASALAVLASCSQDRESPTVPSPVPEPSAPIVYAALGASDALGIGSSVPCLPLVDCPNGTGYVQIIARTLQSGRSVTLANLGFPAAVLSPRIQALGRQYGRDIPANFIEHEMPFVPRDSTVVTIFAGGNDANAVGTSIERGGAGPDVGAYVTDQVRTFASEYQQLVAGIRDRAGRLRIVVANLPNFAGVPYTGGYSPARRQMIQTLSVRFSREAINPLTGQDVVVVDLLCDPRAYDAAHYSSDGYHPSDAGYAFLAAEMLRAITDAAYPAPRDACPQTGLVP